MGGIKKIRGHIAHALQANCLTPAADSQLRGKLGVYAPLVAGKSVWGVTGP